MYMQATASALIATCFALNLGCGGAPAAAPASPAPAASEAPAPSASAAPVASAAPAPAALRATWAEAQGTPEQVAYMKAKVMPAMAKVFQDHEPKEFADFSCKTCHGPNREAPQKFLPKLKISTPDAFAKLAKAKPEDVKFMHEVVEPAMAKAMGDQPFDMKTMKGFGCKGCHAIE